MPPPDTNPLERYRSLLRVEARRLMLNPRLRRLFDSSDLVQETYVKAIARSDQFTGTTPGELVNWMRMILKNIFRDKLDQHGRELDHVHWDEAVDESTRVIEGVFKDDQTSPSEKAEKQERLLRLYQAIDALPDDQRDVIICHHLHGLRIKEIAQNLGRTEKSVAGLRGRGMTELRKQLGSDFD